MARQRLFFFFYRQINNEYRAIDPVSAKKPEIREQNIHLTNPTMH